MKKVNWIVAAFFCTGIMLSSQLSAGTYYVAGEDPKAADTNDGSEAAPWKTITRSVKDRKPGDTVLIKNGTYR